MYSPLFPFLPPRPLPVEDVGLGISGETGKRERKKERALAWVIGVRFAGHRHSLLVHLADPVHFSLHPLPHTPDSFYIKHGL